MRREEGRCPPPQWGIPFCWSKVWGTASVRISKKVGQDLSSCTVHPFHAGVAQPHLPRAQKRNSGLTLYPELQAHLMSLRGTPGAASVGIGHGQVRGRQGILQKSYR